MRSDYLRLNRNILVAFAASITASAAFAQLVSDQAEYLNTTYTLLVDYAVYFTVFGGLYYISNKAKYVVEGGVDRTRLRRDLYRIIASLGVGELVYSAARWTLQYYLLTAGHDAYLASIVSQAASTVIYLIVINLGVRITKLYKDGS